MLSVVIFKLQISNLVSLFHCSQQWIWAWISNV